MRIRETDTSASETLFDALVAGGVLAEDESGVRTTDEFDATHAIYHDSYHGVTEREFHEAVASTFGLPSADAAADLVDERGVTRREFVCYLAVRSHLENPTGGSAAGDGDGDEETPNDGFGADELAAMTEMVDRVVPNSPVPPELPDVTDDAAAFLAGRDRAVLTVWRRFCDPCDSLAARLPDLLATDAEGGEDEDAEVVGDAEDERSRPDPPRTEVGDVAVAGVDGEAATEFCATHEVESAPAVVLFRDGGASADGRSASNRTPREVVTGADADAVAAALRDVYD